MLRWLRPLVFSGAKGGWLDFFGRRKTAGSVSAIGRFAVSGFVSERSCPMFRLSLWLVVAFCLAVLSRQTGRGETDPALEEKGAAHADLYGDPLPASATRMVGTERRTAL
jgi:hypothetical protein